MKQNHFHKKIQQNPDNLEIILLYEDGSSRSNAVEGIVIFDYVIVDSSNPGFSVIAKVISSKDVDVFGSLDLNYHYGIQDKWNFVSGLSILPVRMKGEGILATWKHVFTWRIPQKYLVEKFSYDMKVKTLSGSVYQAINTGNEQYIRRKFSGGRHGSLDSLGGETHHTPANSTSPLSTNDGPVIQMEYADHRKTSSCGKNDVAYRERQSKYIREDNGNFYRAIKMDIEDVTGLFPGKYNSALKEMVDYAFSINRLTATQRDDLISLII